MPGVRMKVDVAHKLSSIKLKRKTPLICTFDIGSDYLRFSVGQKEESEDITFQSVDYFSFSAGDDEAIQKALAKIVQENDLQNKEVDFLIPADQLITKNIDIPSTDPVEISKIIDLQAGRYTPYAREEIVIDYVYQNSEGQHYTSVFLVMINRKAAERLYFIADSARVGIGRLLASPEALARCYATFEESQRTGASLCGVMIGNDHSDFTIVENQQIVFSRSLAKGHTHLDAGEVEEMGKEILNSLSSYHDQGIGAKVQYLALSGFSQPKKLAEWLEARFQSESSSAMQVKMIRYDRLFNIAAPLQKKIAEDARTVCFDLLCAQAFRDDIKMDFVPQEIKMKKKVREGGREMITSGILVMVCMMLLCFFLALKVYIKTDVLDQLDNLSAEHEGQAQLLEKASNKSRLVWTLLKNRGKSIYVFDRVTSLIDKQTYLTSFKYDQEGNVTLVGTATSMSAVFAFVTELEESNYFSSVKTKSTKSRRVGQNDVADFEIECTFEEH